MKMKYEVGDKVKIREDLKVGKDYNDCTFIVDMEKYKGKIATITYCYNDDDSYEIDLDGGTWFWTNDMFKDVTDITESESKDEKTVDIGYYLAYCGHRIIKNVYYNGYVHDDHNHVFCTTVDCKNQYTLPVDSIEFIVPHED